MEQQNSKIVKNNDDNLSSFVRGSGICDKINSQQSNNKSMDKFWEDQWSSQMEGWARATLARHAQATNHFTPRSCDSPSASESSFSVSTQDSASLSAQSEASPIAGKYVLQSPDLSQGRFCKIGLFNPDVKHAKSENVSGEFTKVDKQQDWMLLQEKGIFENIQHASDVNGSGPLRKKLENFVKAKERPVQSPIGLVHSSQGVSDEGWLSDGTESWASASSQDLSWNHLYDGSDGVPSSILYEAPNIHPTNHCHGQGERGWGATDRAGHAAHPVIANWYDYENANISEKQSYTEFNDEITSCDNEGCIHEFIPLQSRFEDRTSAPALASPGSICLTKVQLGVHSPHAGEFERRCFDRYQSLGSRGGADSLNVNMLRKPREVDAYCRRDADCLIQGHQELPVHAGDGHQPFACGLSVAENKALQLHEEHNFYFQNLTKSGSSTCMESASHTKQAHLKSRHSAAVEDKYPSSSLHGHFRFVEQDGSQCYSFSVHDSDEVFFARACQPESESNKEGHNFLYTFHSRRDDSKTKGGWKSWLKKEKLASTLVGKLQISNAKHMRAENGCTEETHFVLYGENSQLPPENEAYKNDQRSGQLDSKLLKSSSSNESKFSKPALDSHSKKCKRRGDCHMPMPAATASQGIIGSCLHEAIRRDDMSRHGSSNFVDVNIACCSNHTIVKQDIPTTPMELAAIVITTTVNEYKVTRKKIYESYHKDGNGWGATFLDKGGWGAGFLGKSSLVGSKLEPAGASEQDQQLNAASQGAFTSDMERLQERTDSEETFPKSSSMSNEKLVQKMSYSKCEQPKMAVDLVVILPAGRHGLLRHDGNCPANDGRPCGPTSLLECWQNGGNCHCGGWDLGCGLSVLKAMTLKLHKKRATIALTNCDRINWITPEKPLQIFTQGWKQKKLLMLEIIQTGIFSLSFQARLSPLQAFATAVAIFHEQITQVKA